jgi:hypothetical protein
MEDVMRTRMKECFWDMPISIRPTGIKGLRRFIAAILVCCGSGTALLAQSDLGVETDVPGKKFTLAYIKYEGGSYRHVKGEMLAHEEQFLPNMLESLRKKQGLDVSDKPEIVKLGDKKLFDCPIFFITGHYRFTIGDQEIDQIREFIKRGGFVYIEDCGGFEKYLKIHGSFFDQMHEVLQKAFPEGRFVVLPEDHDIYKYPYLFPKGLPNFVGKDNDMRPPDTPGKIRKHQGGEGFYVGNTMVAFLGDGDTCCGWSGLSPCGDEPFKMAANVIIYAMTHGGL